MTDADLAKVLLQLIDRRGLDAGSLKEFAAIHAALEMLGRIAAGESATERSAP